MHCCLSVILQVPTPSTSLKQGYERWSQVRIGMDLTKIVLPTFILERRSLLEMYSDFFAHPGEEGAS